MAMPAQKPGKSKQDYGTPPEFLGAVKHLLGVPEFNRDLAASDTNAVGPVYWTEVHDALSKDWTLLEGWNWCNPPYANITPWVKRAAECDRKIAMLVPASVGSHWWRDYIEHTRCLALFLRPRLQFVGTEGSYPKDLALVLYGILPYGQQSWSWKTDAHTLA
jgi:phage N-6-adenine-methyltransferase